LRHRYRFDSQGNYWRERLSKRALVEASGLHARDLIVIDTGFHRTARPALLVREEAFLISLAHIRAIVRHDSVFLLHPDSPGVQDFAARLSGWLKGSGSGSPFLTDPHLPSRHAAFTDGVLMEESTASSGFGEDYPRQKDTNNGANNNNTAAEGTMSAGMSVNGSSPGGKSGTETPPVAPSGSGNETVDHPRHPELPPIEPAGMTLPASLKMEAVPPPSITRPRGFQGRHAESSHLAFESKVLESVLSTVCQQCDDRLVLISPLVKSVLDSLNTRAIDPEVLHQLLPMKDVLSQFEIEVGPLWCV
jgi:hypothetical protein